MSEALMLNSTAITWPMVMLALIAALPGIIAAIASLIGARRGGQNAKAIDDVHTLVDGRFTKVQALLDAAYAEISRITGKTKGDVRENPPPAEPPQPGAAFTNSGQP